MAGYSPKLSEYLDFCIVFKQIIGLIIGVMFGFLGFQGIGVIVSYLIISSLITLYYSRNYIEIDEDEIENYQIYSSGAMPGFVIYLFSWILSFTFFHHT